MANAITHGHDVATLYRRNPQTYGQLPVELEQPPWRLFITTFHRGHVPKVELPAGTIRSDSQIEHFINRPKATRWIERGIFCANAHPSAVGDDVFRLELGVDLIFIDPELREALPRDFEENRLLLLGKKIDFLHILHRLKLAAEELGVAAELGEREARSGNREKDTVDVPEIVDHHRASACRRRQLGLDVGNFSAEFIPNLWDRIPMIPVLDDDAYDRPTPG